jgi:hypothetical protein
MEFEHPAVSPTVTAAIRQHAAAARVANVTE